MDRIKAGIKLTMSLKEHSMKELVIHVEIEGVDHDVMEVADIAQQTQLVGEAFMERVLVAILNENPNVITTPNTDVH